MKKTFVDIKEVASFNSLYNGYMKVTEGKKRYRRDVKPYEQNLSENLKNLSRRLLDETWEPSAGYTFMLFTEGKWREINTLPIEDRIVHQSLVYHMGYHIRKRFIRRTYGSIKNRGTLKASKQLRRDLYKGVNYIVQWDMKKFYPSIDKDKLKELIRRKIKGESALRLMNKIIDAYKPKTKRGISIGALTSQTNGNWMLTPFDYFCLDTMKVHFYERNIDDIVMGFRTKEEAAEKIPQMKSFIETLGVTIGKLIVFPVDKQKVSFCMYMHEKGHTELRPKPMRRFSKLLNYLETHEEDPLRERSRVCSYLGFLKHCDSYNILKEKRHEHSKVFSRINGCSALSNRKKRDIESSKSRDE